MIYNFNKGQFAGSIILMATILPICYAVLRYNIFGDIAWKGNLPIFVLNKGISLSSFILLSVNFSLGPLKNIRVKISDRLLDTRKIIGLTGFLYAFLHLILSIAVLNPTYYSNFFIEDGTLSIRGVLSLAGGILSFIFLYVYKLRFEKTLKEQKRIITILSSKKILLSAMLFMGIHLFFIGYTGWSDISIWQGGLPPISLISFIILLIGFIINLLGRE